MDSAGGYSGNGEEGVAGAQRNPQNQTAQKRLQQTQAKVDEVHLKPWIWIQVLMVYKPAVFWWFSWFLLSVLEYNANISKHYILVAEGHT